MKKIIIFLLLVLLAIYGFNTYKKMERFSFDNYAYQPIEIPEGSEELLTKQYFSAIEEVNGYVITQWSFHKIDVRNPKEASAVEKNAVISYRKKLAHVKYIESRLKEAQIATNALKKNQQIQENKNAIKEIFKQSKRELRLGDKGVLVFELQRILNKKGATIKQDGLFKEETFQALKDFESNEGLYADGKLDFLTLEYLLR